MTTSRPIEVRISRNPAVLGGKPIIRGTRLAVSLVAGWIDTGTSVEQILEDYPNLTRDDVEAAVAYARAPRDQIDVRSS
ncbi:MAG: DUF433 domain-containing protein [Chloroflexota bacterium]|nr:DUF433 domain-containing protein [Chloroflexota bacterium]